MDSEYFRDREQTERMLAERTTSSAARAAHLAMADAYRSRIDRRDRGPAETD